jgi:hydrogenase nickel incorporation protein HypB
MCKDCGCGKGSNYVIDGDHHSHHDHSSAHGGHGHSPAEAGHAHGQAAPEAHTIKVHQSILDLNDRQAERNRGFFKAKGILAINVLSSPGSGKTTLLQKTAAALQGRLRVAVIVGDLATDNDATRLREAGVPVVQIKTGTLCHLEAEMVAKAMEKLDLTQVDLLVIENVGNLVCPAVYDLGERLRVVLLSTTEGEDKPLKYPPMFHSASVAIITKTDMAEAAGFDRAQALANLQRVSHHARIFELSAKTGQGLPAWCDFLVQAHQKARG